MSEDEAGYFFPGLEKSIKDRGFEFDFRSSVIILSKGGSSAQYPYGCCAEDCYLISSGPYDADVLHVLKSYVEVFVSMQYFNSGEIWEYLDETGDGDYRC